jgi:hypothetical protein
LTREIRAQIFNNFVKNPVYFEGLSPLSAALTGTLTLCTQADAVGGA